MKVSESWLSEWVNTSLGEEALAEKLTMAGLEVDSISPVSDAFDGVVVAYVLEASPHPKADRLTICQVDAGASEPYQIVCGAANVRKGLKVALALPGAHLPGGIHIKETTLRDVPSQGMICASTELGLEETSEGIMELPQDAPIGTALGVYLNLDDKVLTIELTPNRSDCFSMRGVAREVSALTNTSLNVPVIDAVTARIDKAWPVTIDATTACPGYAVRLIEGINPEAETPLWMKERLRRAGVRPISPAVDVTQYVMLEFGQPMHAFDAARVKGPICVRFSKKDERIVLLDEAAVTLKADVLLIADDEKPLAIAGVMGGKTSAVDEQTTAVLLESAFFAPEQIAGVARQYGLCTDASQRYERGVDPALHREMIERATQLLIDIAGGEPGPVTWEHTKDFLPEISIQFNPERVQALTGLSVPHDTMQSMLQALGMSVDVSTTPSWHVSVPSFRFDLRLEVDLIEEITRLYGYDKLEPASLAGPIVEGQVAPFFAANKLAAQCLIARGYYEIISYSFIDSAVQAAFFPKSPALKLVNPLSSELSEMRTSLWPGLISALIHNTSRRQETMKFFEVGVVFDVSDDGALTERPKLAGLITGESGAMNWATAAHAYDFFDIKADLSALSQCVKKPLQFVPDTHHVLHPGQSARVICDNTPIGWLGVLHPSLVESLDLDLKTDVMLFEVDLLWLQERARVRYQPISKYPQVRRDLSLLMPCEVSAEQVERLVRDTLTKHTDALKSFNIFDHYTGEQVPAGQKSLAIAMVFQAASRTLTENDVTPAIDTLIQAFETELGIYVRD